MNKVALVIVSLVLAMAVGLSGCATISPPPPAPQAPPMPAPPEEEVAPEPEKKCEVVRIEVSAPRPINKVMMLSSMGHHWGRIPPETRWHLEKVVFDVKNFLPNDVHLDKAIVEVAGQLEEVPIDISLEPKEYQVVRIEILSINGVESGSYLLHVSLESNSAIMCEREDTAKVFWPDDSRIYNDKTP